MRLGAVAIAETPAQKIKGRSVCDNSPRPNTLHTALNMLDTCPLSAGVYKITAKTGPVGAGTCGNRVVVKNASVGPSWSPLPLVKVTIHHQIFFIMQNRYGPGNCTYSLYANHTEGVLDLDDNVVVEDSPVVNEWVITPRGGNTYT